MADRAFLLDLGRCIGCEACVAACKTGNELEPGRQFIHIGERIQGTFPDLSGGFDNHRCFHCADAACVAVCPTGALFKETGLTRLDRSVCSGCGYCVEACPYDVPEMFEGLSSKCDGCAAAVGAGGDPWCVKTCPSSALMFADRDEVLAEAERRATALRVRYPRAQVYGTTQAGGLGMIVVLPDDPEALGLPADPRTPVVQSAWQKVVQPGAITLTAGTAVLAGVMAVIARRNHLQELAALEAAAAATAAPPEAPSPTEEA